MKPNTPAAAAAAAAAITDDPSTSPSDSASAKFTVERRSEASASCRWTLPDFPRTRARTFYSRYFEVGGFDCRLLLYPRGDSQALPGHLSLYLQVLDPKTPVSSSSSTTTTSSSKWDCFLSYRLSVVHPTDPAKSVGRDSWHRFSSKKRSHGWCDFAPFASAAFLFQPHDALVIAADISVLSETSSFADTDGRFTWKILNFSIFREMIRTQKIMSPAFFPAVAVAGGADCGLRISVYQSNVSGADHLSVCLESKDSVGQAASGSSALVSCAGSGVSDSDRGCWCIFRVSILNQRSGGNHIHKDSYGRFGADNASLGWGDYVKMDEFLAADSGYLVGGAVVFSASVHVIKESNSFTRNLPMAVGIGGVVGRAGARKSDGHFGKFMWRIESFTKLKELLKKRKITGLCIKSRRFQVGSRDCRLIVYPRGQSQPPCHLSVFLEVTDPQNTASEWSCFVSHRLSVINQKAEEKSIMKESQNRYSKSAKDWGWREFVTLTSLFDQDAGFLVQDTVVFSAEVLILKETATVQDLSKEDPEICSSSSVCQMEALPKRPLFTWKVENFLSFKEIMETRKIFSIFFRAGGCELRIGVYESFDMICIYLESDQSSGTDPDKNFWVHYKMAIVNQKNSAKTVFKESSICTKTWNNSVLQFMKVSDMLDTDAGFLVRDTVVFVCEIIDCCPWFDFSDLEVLASDDDRDELSTDPDELIDSEDKEDISGDDEDVFCNLLSRAGFSVTYGDNYSQPQVTLREKILTDASAIAGFLTGLRVYLDNPAKVKRMFLPTKVSTKSGGKKDGSKCDSTSTSLISLLMGVSALKQAIIDLLLDIMVECCQPSEEKSTYGSAASTKTSPDSNGTSSPPELSAEGELTESACSNMCAMAESNGDDIRDSPASQDAGLATDDATANTLEHSCFLPETSATDLPADEESEQASQLKWPEQSVELLGLIINSLRVLDSAVPHGCPEPRKRPDAIQKIVLVLEKSPKQLKPDLIALIPKLIDGLEHSRAACVLLDHLQKPDAEPSLRLPVFSALSELEFESDIWKQASVHALELLSDSNDESLVAAIIYVLKVASQCQHLPQAAKAVRWRLKVLGTEVPHCVLDLLSKTIQTQPVVAQAMLKDIDSDCEPDNDCQSSSGSNCTADDLTFEGVYSRQEQPVHGRHHLSDVFVLIEMLSIPRLFVQVTQIFERALLRRAFGLQLVAMVLERRHSHRSNLKSGSVVNDSQNKVLLDGQFESLTVQEDDFSSVLALCEVLSLSTETKVQDFVQMLYGTMFKIYAEDHYRYRILKGLVERATNTSDNCQAVDIDMDVLVFLIKENYGFGRPVLNMMREVAEVAQADRANLWHQLCATEDENIRLREEMEMEQTNFTNEKAALSQRLTESEATVARLKSELKVERDHFICEKKKLSDQMLEMEKQVDWMQSEKDEQIAKLSADKKALHDRLSDAESQVSMVKARKREELKKLTNEKNILTERLKNAETSRKRSDEESKRYAAETLTREEIRKSLENEVRRLTQTVGQAVGEKKEKEEQISRCEAYIDGMESKLQAQQQYIQRLETSLHDWMTRHDLLCGAGVEDLSLDKLEALANIHEQNLRRIRAIQQRKGSDHLLGGTSLAHVPGLFSSPSSVAAGLPSSLIPTSPIAPNGASIRGSGSGRVNVMGNSWFNPT